MGPEPMINTLCISVLCDMSQPPVFIPVPTCGNLSHLWELVPLAGTYFHLWELTSTCGNLLPLMGTYSPSASQSSLHANNWWSLKYVPLNCFRTSRRFRSTFYHNLDCFTNTEYRFLSNNILGNVFLFKIPLPCPIPAFLSIHEKYHLMYSVHSPSC